MALQPRSGLQNPIAPGRNRSIGIVGADRHRKRGATHVGRTAEAQAAPHRNRRTEPDRGSAGTTGCHERLRGGVMGVDALRTVGDVTDPDVEVQIQRQTQYVEPDAEIRRRRRHPNDRRLSHPHERSRP